MQHFDEIFTQTARAFRQLQNDICAAVEQADGAAAFAQDAWQRPGGGGGRSRVLSGGAVFEKAGVGFSEVDGELTPEFAKQLPGDGLAFAATGVSLVLHPRSPHVPTVHMNVRLVVHGKKAWFGGGADLTPYYPVQEDVVHFHKTWKRVCGEFPSVADYPRYKAECDRYFYLPHRQEQRGVGGIFFEYLDATPESLAFVMAVGNNFWPGYGPIVDRRKYDAVTQDERWFQEYRRGRYVEFNLLHDRGTLFGLKTQGRTESILMSLPPVVRYEYNRQPAPNSREASLTDYWLKPRDWADEPAG